MRSRDWSSDVCASDLLAIGREIIRVQNVLGKIFNAGTDFERNGSEFDRLFEDGDRFAIGNIDAIALHVPGHTPADMAYAIGDAVFTGDTQIGRASCRERVCQYV